MLFRSDIFSMGVVLFNMSTGQMPFKIANQEDENYNKIMNNMYHEFWKNFEGINVSLELKDLILRMIC